MNEKLLRAFRHYVYRNHPFEPSRCEGCLEGAGFLTTPGYQGTDEPVLQ